METERLELIPLTASQLTLYANNLSALEEELHCYYQAEPVKGFFAEILRGQIKPTQEDPVNYKWHTFWLLLRKADRVVVGSADFKNIPSENGSVEIGYGLGKAFEGNGYMTEAVNAMCEWAFSYPTVKTITAETELQNIPSQNILKRCGFVETQRNESIWWELLP